MRVSNSSKAAVCIISNALPSEKPSLTSSITTSLANSFCAITFAQVAPTSPAPITDILLMNIKLKKNHANLKDIFKKNSKNLVYKINWFIFAAFLKSIITNKNKKMDENLTHEQSLALINEMIHRARNNVKKGGTYSMIFWGYLTAALAIINFVLLHTLNEPTHSFWIWWFMLPAGAVSYFIERRVKRETLVKTHIDKIGVMVWMGFLISFAVFTIVMHSVNIRFDIWQVFMMNLPVVLIMLGMGQFVSACIYRNNIWYAIAALTWSGAILCAFMDVDKQFIVFAVCMIIGFVVPGHIINVTERKSKI
jgi:MFS family permease